jgi:hypothetical protein
LALLLPFFISYLPNIPLRVAPQLPFYLSISLSITFFSSSFLYTPNVLSAFPFPYMAPLFSFHFLTYQFLFSNIPLHPNVFSTFPFPYLAPEVGIITAGSNG